MKKILLIEDHDEIRENTAEILELANYSVFTASNGKEGIEIALKEIPDLIICDIMMPVLDGYGVLHLLHKNEELKHIPFIFLTAKTERSELRKGMESGADDYITKPFSGVELLTAIESRLNKIDQLKKDFTGGLEGLQQIQKSKTGKDIINELTADRNINKFKKKQIIFSEGNRPSKLFYVLSGKVKTIKTNEDGKQLVVGLFKEGDFLGHTALLQDCSYQETAEAMEDTSLAIIPREDFDSMIHDNPEILKQFARLMAKNISEIEEHLLGLAYNSLRKKVADALITLFRKYRKTEDPNFAIDISRENLAAVAGTATESLIRTLSDFKSEHLIDIKEGHISLMNEKKLVSMAN